MAEQKQTNPEHREVGPTSIDGVEASDLPDGGRDKPHPHDEVARKSPKRTGENSTGDVGIAALPASADSRDHGGRKKN